MSPLSTELQNQSSQPVKRKRGRPPKNNKPADAFPTFTMQLQSSPLSGGPNAEFTSNQVVLGGEPDTFTPLMKVLPSPHRKKRRRSSNFTLPLDPTRFPNLNQPVGESRSYIASPMNGSFDTRVLDNLSTVLNSLVDQAPPPETPHKGGLEPGFVLLAEEFTKRAVRKNLAYSTHEESSKQHLELLNSRPDEPVQYSGPLSPELEPTWHVDIPVDSNGDLDLFGFELVVDENGQATLIDKPGVVVSSIPGYPIGSAGSTQEAQPFNMCGYPAANQRGARKTHSLQEMNLALGIYSGAKQKSEGENFYLNGYTGVAEIIESPDLNHSLSQDFENSLTRMVDYTPNDENPRVCFDKLGYIPPQLTPLSSKSGIFHDFPAELPSLAMGESDAGLLAESADARTALRKVCRRR